ncbi:hypothetical protein Avbf_16723, partial [Armadillidium vulgare]
QVTYTWKIEPFQVFKVLHNDKTFFFYQRFQHSHDFKIREDFPCIFLANYVTPRYAFSLMKDLCGVHIFISINYAIPNN